MQRLNLTLDELKALRNLMKNSRRRNIKNDNVIEYTLELKIANAILDAQVREEFISTQTRTATKTSTNT